MILLNNYSGPDEHQKCFEQSDGLEKVEKIIYSAIFHFVQSKTFPVKYLEKKWRADIEQCKECLMNTMKGPESNEYLFILNLIELL